MQYKPRGSRTGQAAWKRARARLIKTREHICHWCDKPLRVDAAPRTSQAIEIDHLLPVFAGGTDEDDNLVLACHPCNSSKGNRAAPQRRLDPNGGVITATKCVIHGDLAAGQLLATCPHSGTLIRPDEMQIGGPRRRQ